MIYPFCRSHGDALYLHCSKVPPTNPEIYQIQYDLSPVKFYFTAAGRIGMTILLSILTVTWIYLD